MPTHLIGTSSQGQLPVGVVLGVMAILGGGRLLLQYNGNRRYKDATH